MLWWFDSRLYLFMLFERCSVLGGEKNWSRLAKQASRALTLQRFFFGCSAKAAVCARRILTRAGVVCERVRIDSWSAFSPEYLFKKKKYFHTASRFPRLVVGRRTNSDTDTQCEFQNKSVSSKTTMRISVSPLLCINVVWSLINQIIYRLDHRPKKA